MLYIDLGFSVVIDFCSCRLCGGSDFGFLFLVLVGV